MHSSIYSVPKWELFFFPLLFYLLIQVRFGYFSLDKACGLFWWWVFLFVLFRTFGIDCIFPPLLLEEFVQENVFAFVSFPSTCDSQLPSWLLLLRDPKAGMALLLHSPLIPDPPGKWQCWISSSLAGKKIGSLQSKFLPQQLDLSLLGAVIWTFASKCV